MNAIKPTVRIYGTRPEMAIVYSIVQSIYNAHGQDCVITSGVGKKHSDLSLHPVGYAHDYRTKHLPASIKQQLIFDIRAALPCCDVVYEHDGQPQEHLHVEFDPKDDPQFQGAKLIYKSTKIWPDR